MGRGAARTSVTLVIAALLPFAALVLVMIQFQANLLFPAHAVPHAGPLPAGAQTLEVRTTDGETLQGVHFGPATKGPQARTLIFGFGGNAWNGQEVATYLHDIYPEAHVVAFHYRGYRPSTGRPSAEALMADAPLLFDETVKRIQPDRTVAVGFSIGSGIAASLSRRRDLDGLILVTPFDSLKAVAQELYPWLPVGLFFQHEIAAADHLAGAKVPVAILAAERDGIIASGRTDALRRRISNLRFDRTIAGAGHNDIYQRAEFHAALHEALDSIASK